MADTRLSLPRRRWTQGAAEAGDRLVAEETAVAIVHDASSTAVLMATPADLVDLAVGFTLTEGLIDHPDEIRSVEEVPGRNGVEVRVWLPQDRGARLAARRRRMAGPTGCGLCGVESLEEAVRHPRRVAGGLRVSPTKDAALREEARAVAGLSLVPSLARPAETAAPVAVAPSLEARAFLDVEVVALYW